MTGQLSIDKDVLDTGTVAKCLEFYIDVVKAIYKKTRPKLDQAQILSNDRWRYDLSTQVQPDQGLSKDELARLVQWKM